MNKQILIAGVIILVIVGGGGLFLMSQSSAQPAPKVTTNEAVEGNAESTGIKVPEDVLVESSGAAGANDETVVNQGATKEFAVNGANYSFSVKEMKVKKGDTVKVTFTNNESMHDWVIDEFSARTKVLPAGQSETIEFVADRVGTFEYYCNIGQHRQNGMAGKLIVE